MTQDELHAYGVALGYEKARQADLARKRETADRAAVVATAQHVHAFVAPMLQTMTLAHRPQPAADEGITRDGDRSFEVGNFGHSISITVDRA